MNRPQESELHMLVDGRLESGRVAELETWLAEHPEEKANVLAWRNQRNALHAAFDHLNDAPIPNRLRPETIRVSRKRNWQLAVAAAIAWLTIGGIAGFVARDFLPASHSSRDVLADLPRDAAIAHAVYVPEVRHPVEVGAEQEAHLVQWLSKRVGHPLSAPNLRPQGFELVGGRLLPSEAGAVAQFMYQDKAGLRLTLYIRRGPSGGETGFRFANEGKLSIFYWLDDSLGCALSGELPRERLLAIAEDAYGQIVSK